MFGCIITGSLCSIVPVLSCVAACYVVADCKLRYEINIIIITTTKIILFQRVQTCLTLFQDYFRGLLQLMNILQHVQCH